MAQPGRSESGAVRGFVSSSIERGIYEFVRDASQLKAIAAKRGAYKAVWLRGESLGNAVYQWNTTGLYDFKTNTVLLKFRNKQCSYTFYSISPTLVPRAPAFFQVDWLVT